MVTNVEKREGQRHQPSFVATKANRQGGLAPSGECQVVVRKAEARSHCPERADAAPGKFVSGAVLSIIVLALLSSLAFAYQQSYLVFSLDSVWKIDEQRMAVQSFAKGGLHLEVRVTEPGDLLTAEEFAKMLDQGKLVSEEDAGEVHEYIVSDSSLFYIMASIPHGKEVYALAMIGPLASMGAGKSEMRKLYPSLSFSTEQKVVTAPWEEKLEYPEGVPFLQKHPIPWGWLIFWVVVGSFIWWRVRKRKARKAARAEGHHPKEEPIHQKKK